MVAEVKNPWTRGFKVNQAVASSWAIETVVPIFWTTTPFVINAQNPKSIEFINAWTTKAHFITKHPRLLVMPCSNFSAEEIGKSQNITPADYGISVKWKSNTSASPWVPLPSLLA